MTSYAGKLRVVYMHMVVHPALVMDAHHFACAAAKQGKFVKYHDGVYGLFASYATSSGRDRTVFDLGHLIDVGKSVGLDTKALVRDGGDVACRRRVEQDQEELAKFKVNGTPTFFVNGVVIGGGVPRDTLAEAIDRELKVADASGIPASQYYQRGVMERGERTVTPKKRAPTLP